MIEAQVAGVGILGPGLAGWQDSAAILRGERPYVAAPVELAAPAVLSPRERRRSGMTVRLALNVAMEAVDQAAIPASDLAPVFGTANGDGDVVHSLLLSLSQSDKVVSPTQFHNSVHNAAVGYWAIGAASHEPSTCIAAHDFTFAATLVKAMTHIACERRPVLLVVYDSPFPEPLASARPMAPQPFGAGLVLAPPNQAAGFARLTLKAFEPAAAEPTPPAEAALRNLWSGNPAARALPVLDTLARMEPATRIVRHPRDGHLVLDIAPC